MKRGDWYNTKELMLMGPDWIVNEIKASGSARARRRRVPVRAQVVVHAQGARPLPARDSSANPKFRTQAATQVVERVDPDARTRALRESTPPPPEPAPLR